MIRDFFATITSFLRLRAAELQHGLTLIEAVSADEFETELRYTTTTEDERAGLRRSAIEAAKAGFTGDELVQAMTFYRLEYRRDYDLNRIVHYIESIRAESRS